MNSKQKRVLIMGIAIVLLSFILWQLSGGETFTQTEVLVEKKDGVFGRTTEQLENKFVWGLDLTLIVSGLTLVIGGYAFNKFNKL